MSAADLGGYAIMAGMAAVMIGGALYTKLRFTGAYWARRFNRTH